MKETRCERITMKRKKEIRLLLVIATNVCICFLPRTLLGFGIISHLIAITITISPSPSTQISRCVHVYTSHQLKYTRSYWNALNVYYFQLSRRHSLNKFHFISLLRFNELLSARLLHRYVRNVVVCNRSRRCRRRPLSSSPFPFVVQMQCFFFFSFYSVFLQRSASPLNWKWSLLTAMSLCVHCFTKHDSDVVQINSFTSPWFTLAFFISSLLAKKLFQNTILHSLYTDIHSFFFFFFFLVLLYSSVLFP